MSDWVSTAEAEAIIHIRTGVQSTKELLQSAIEAGSVLLEPGAPVVEPMKGDMFRDAINLYAGGFTYVDLEEDALLRSTMDTLGQPRRIDRKSLEEWLFDLATPVRVEEKPAPIKPHRPVGRNMILKDAPIVERMRTLIETGQASGPHAAATKIFTVEPQLKSPGSLESNVRRLTGRYSEAYGK